jgi:hypothetical protein
VDVLEILARSVHRENREDTSTLGAVELPPCWSKGRALQSYKSKADARQRLFQT